MLGMFYRRVLYANCRTDGVSGENFKDNRFEIMVICAVSREIVEVISEIEFLKSPL